MSQQFDHIPDFFETVTDELARVVRRNTIILSIVAIVAGVCLLAWPGHTLAVVAVIMGFYLLSMPLCAWWHYSASKAYRMDGGYSRSCSAYFC